MAEPRSIVPYQDLVDSPFPPYPNVSGAAPSATAVAFRGPSVAYQAYTEPPQAPPNQSSVVPPGVGAYLSYFPDPVRTRRLPEMGTPYVFLLPLEVSGVALSWVPVYYGQSTKQRVAVTFPFSQVMNPPFVTSLTVPPQWSAYYPDRLARAAQPNVGTDLAWTVLNIAPPAPPTFTRNPFPNLYRRWFLYDMRN